MKPEQVNVLREKRFQKGILFGLLVGLVAGVACSFGAMMYFASLAKATPSRLGLLPEFVTMAYHVEQQSYDKLPEGMKQKYGGDLRFRERRLGETLESVAQMQRTLAQPAGIEVLMQAAEGKPVNPKTDLLPENGGLLGNKTASTKVSDDVFAVRIAGDGGYSCWYFVDKKTGKVLEIRP